MENLLLQSSKLFRAGIYDLMITIGEHELEVGDVLVRQISGSILEHVGIVYSVDKGVLIVNSLGYEGDIHKVQIVDIKEFSRGNKVFVVKRNAWKSPINSLDITMDRIHTYLNETKYEYNLIYNNCQHFVFDCIFSKKESYQINTLKSIMMYILYMFAGHKTGIPFLLTYAQSELSNIHPSIADYCNYMYVLN